MHNRPEEVTRGPQLQAITDKSITILSLFIHFESFSPNCIPSDPVGPSRAHRGAWSFALPSHQMLLIRPTSLRLRPIQRHQPSLVYLNFATEGPSSAVTRFLLWGMDVLQWQ